MNKLCLFLAVIFMIIAQSCLTSENDLSKDVEKGILIENTQEIKEDVSLKIIQSLKSQRLTQGVKNMTNLSLQNVSGTYYIAGNGEDKDGTHLVFRSKIEVKKLSNGTFVINKFLKSGETCEGVNCQECAFADGGGCICKKPGGNLGDNNYCNHTITKGDNNP